jgi:hypothetical protein
MISRRPEFFGRASSRFDYVMTVTRRMPYSARYQLIADCFRPVRQNVGLWRAAPFVQPLDPVIKVTEERYRVEAMLD